MPLFDNYNPTDLGQTLQKSADTATAGIRDQYAQQRKRLVAQQAASGRLMSGVADYPLTDLDTEEAGQLSGVQDRLAQAFGSIPSEDWQNNRQFNRQLDLAKYIGSLMKPSTLDEIFQGIGAATKVGGTIASAAALA